MRPKDEKGVAMPPPHLRLDEAPKLTEAALFALAGDSRAAALPTKRKLAMIEKAIDHVVDGYVVPKWIHAKDPAWAGNTFLVDLWRLAVEAIRAQWKAA